MTTRDRFVAGACCAAMLLASGGVGYHQLPALAAGGILHPARRPVTQRVPQGCEETTFAGAGVELKGWRCAPSGSQRGTLVYLHGVADNRASSIGIIDRFTRRGLEVVAYDSRAHGESGGEACTYGFFESKDLGRVLDATDEGPIVLFGASLGAAVALQHAAENPRVTAVVAAETFSDLRTVAAERAPFFFSASLIARAFEKAASLGQFDIDAASPVLAAPSITAPVLLIHGAADVDTPPGHSRRVFDALRGPKRLIIVPGAGHNGSVQGHVWSEIEAWIDAVLPSTTTAHAAQPELGL